jgi:phosphate/sulfate permease
MLFVIIVWFVASLLIGLWAEKWHRSAMKYAVISLLLSPVVGAFVVGILGVNKKALERKNQETRERKKAFKERLNNTYKELMGKNNFSQYIEIFEKNSINNIDIILALTDYDLEKLGMNNIGERKRFIQLFKEFTAGKIKA